MNYQQQNVCSQLHPSLDFSENLSKYLNIPMQWTMISHSDAMKAFDTWLSLIFWSKVPPLNNLIHIDIKISIKCVFLSSDTFQLQILKDLKSKTSFAVF